MQNLESQIRNRNSLTGAPRAKQSWQIGEVVNVGFLKGLMVTKKIPTPGDYAPDKYLLVSRDGRSYEFTPHRGVTRIN